MFYLMALAEQGIRGAAVMLACEDYPSLLDRQISKIRTEFPPSLGELKEGVTRDFHLAEKYGSGRILLRNLDDPAKYLSAEFAGIAVDELTRNERSVFDFLRSRLRWPGVSRPGFVAGTNPSGIGHAWVKGLWIEHNFPTELKRLEPEFYFVPAKSSDNPYLSEEYHKDLETLPPDMARAYAEGSWEVFAGQYFDIWGTGEKFVDRPEDWNIRPWWPRWISIDWGFEHPAAVYWHAMDDDGRTLTYREYVTRQDSERRKIDPLELGAEIVKRSTIDCKVERIADVYLSPDAFAQRTSEKPIAEQLGDVLVRAGMPRPSHADDDRVGGWMLMYQMLKTGYWRIGANCAVLCKTLPMLIRDESKIEDVAKSDGDDAPDAARYGLKSRHAPRQKPLETRVMERISEVQKQRQEVGLPPQTDPTMIAMMAQKAQAEERKKDKPIPLITRGRWQRPRLHL